MLPTLAMSRFTLCENAFVWDRMQRKHCGGLVQLAERQAHVFDLFASQIGHVKIEIDGTEIHRSKKFQRYVLLLLVQNLGLDAKLFPEPIGRIAAKGTDSPEVLACRSNISTIDLHGDAEGVDGTTIKDRPILKLSVNI